MNQFFSSSADDNSENKQHGFGRQKTDREQKHTLYRSAPRLEGEMNFAYFARHFKRKWMRLWTALKWQFHEKTLHLFENLVFRRVALASASVFILYNMETEFLAKLARPIFGIFRSDSARINEDYPQTEFSITGGGRTKISGERPKPKKASWSGFLGGDGGNLAAPVAANQLHEIQAREYIEKYHKIAIAEMEKFGIPASIGLAQGLVESRAGHSKLAKNNNNHFGMKCFSKKCPKGHCSNMTDDHHKDFFRKYKSGWESWRAHSQLLAGGHYSRLKKYGRDYQQWAYGLKALGYATDRTYAEKLIGMIEKYELDRFDK